MTPASDRRGEMTSVFQGHAMSRANAEFVMGLENECLTAVEDDPDARSRNLALGAFLGGMSRLAPSLPGPSGMFNGYGRVYLDLNRHLELASAECDSPFLLADLVERQHR